ncbi:30S ribosomal protein S16 [Wickerhamomyces ciferrii]|uniref:30S ribosomal protein S16 n=1 Tax=Wickerhamomyces ciferrii (strain ATCC 14091 / BCRC 22168 / CBS 111 / JCM 3599 / NBRC 0793 / NRRL Y-1031 F-60-10) TaxID=1206466 RepID=K0KLN3_WICCF|nr:30S ribosomal protein S16 [Wickerhamomyces ciferrii]CCH43891.1 30S ribosomal protein S16 [Wickerhamomyces ciferrii]
MTKGLVRIRLARFGRVNQPVYNIVVSQAKKARDSKPIEVIGTYNPIAPPPKKLPSGKLTVPAKKIELDFDRAKYWLSVGAQPTIPIIRMFKRANLWV